jgi:uncharacterized protein
VDRLVVLAAVGLFAQLVDGSLGMGYGVTSASLLIAAGYSPAIVSASVHAAQVVTTTVSGFSHWRFGNIDARVTLPLALPGGVGGFLGAFFLVSLPVAVARPLIACILLVLGAMILWRFARQPQAGKTDNQPVATTRRLTIHNPRLLVPLGFVAGFCDSTGGGGWGPISTSTLLSRRESTPRTVVGSVSASEAVVTIAATLGFFLALGVTGFRLQWILALMVGGIVAAPIAAWLAGRLPAYLMGTLIGGLLILLNSRTIVHSLGINATSSLIIFGAILLVWVSAVILTVTRQRVRVRAVAPGD